MPNERPELTNGEKIFIGGIIVSTFVVALAFVIATVGWGYAFPGVFVAITLGICIASIVYAFLGGVSGAEFTAINGIKIAGSMAVIAVVYWLISEPLSENMNDAKAVAIGKMAESEIDRERRAGLQERTRRIQAERKVLELQSQAGIDQSESDAALLARVRQSSPEDGLGRGVIDIFLGREGPFKGETTELKARFIESVSSGSFRFCHGQRPNLRDRMVQFEIVDQETGTSKKIQLDAGADIGPGPCQVIEFDVQIGCDAAKELLQLSCDRRNGVAWPTAADNRVYNLVATSTNPAFDR